MTMTSEQNPILLIEDDFSLGETLRIRLNQNYRIIWKSNYRDALDEFNANNRDLSLIILDVNLPDGNGFELGKIFRQKSSTVPIMFLTAQADAEARLKGFELGAVDYVPKPFHLKELLLRVSKIIGLSENRLLMQKKELELIDCTINFVDMRVLSQKGEFIYPPASDLKVMQLLVENSPKVLSRDEIIDRIWGVDESVNHRTVDNVISRLRHLIGENNKDNIRSVRGIGYQWIMAPLTTPSSSLNKESK